MKTSNLKKYNIGIFTISSYTVMPIDDGIRRRFLYFSNYSKLKSQQLGSRYVGDKMDLAKLKYVFKLKQTLFCT